ncbi:MAG: histone deacetylase [Planctomycetota bacterium]
MNLDRSAAPNESSSHSVFRREFLGCTAGKVVAWSGTVSLLASRWAISDDSQAKEKGRTALVSDELFTKHDTGPSHPERPARMKAVADALARAKLTSRLPAIRPRAVTEKEIHACHQPDYVAQARRDIDGGASQLSTGDTNVSKESMRAAEHAAGGVCAAIDAIAKGSVQNAFCAVRPPGHHATPSRGMGFCILNSAAIAARYAQRKHGWKKVLIVDWDVHHGNGTQDVFYDDPSVFFFSTHQSPWYPGTGMREETGRGPGVGSTMNRPLPAGAGRREVLGAFEKDLMPAMAKFQPDLVIVSAGFDSRRGDPLGRFQLDDRDFADLTRSALAIAKKYSKSRLVSVLEGGYSLDGLGRGVAAHVKTLLDG